MSLFCGIIGLPNIGKSTLFNCLTSAQAESANYPFCTIEPNIGVVDVPDYRLKLLAEIVSSARILPASVKFVDIAGLVKGASSGEGLGNKFLNHIRQTDAICHVVRCFNDGEIIHVEQDIDPVRDVQIIETELILADIELCQKTFERLNKTIKDKSIASKKILLFCEHLINHLNNNRLAKDFSFDQEDDDLCRFYRQLQLLTDKPILFVANVDEEYFSKKNNLHLNSLSTFLNDRQQDDMVVVCAKIEQEIAYLKPEDRSEFLKELGVEISGLDRIIKSAFRILNLQTYFTAGIKEVRAWTIPVGIKAPVAAGVIHSDFERGFIKADIINWKDFIKFKGEAGCRAAGLIRTEGKEYIVKDGDVINFKFNV